MEFSVEFYETGAGGFPVRYLKVAMERKRDWMVRNAS